MSWRPPNLKTECLDLTAPINQDQLAFNPEGEAASEIDFPGLPSNWAIFLKETDKAIGSIGVMRWERECRLAEIGFILDHRFRNRGFMTEACQAVVAFGFEGMQLKTIEARSFPHNLASIRVFEKIGMKKEKSVSAQISLQGALVDLLVYRIQRIENIEDRDP